MSRAPDRERKRVPAREPPPPLEANDQLVDAAITVGWAIALVVLLVIRTDLRPGERWWIWVAVVGAGQGLFGLVYLPYLKRSRQRAALRREARRQGHHPRRGGSGGPRPPG